MTDSQALCSSCARCCNGSMFGATHLESTEADALGVRQLEQRPYGCKFLGPDKRCTIYATRPGACVRYRCPVLEQFEAGKLTLEQARAAVQTLSR